MSALPRAVQQQLEEADRIMQQGAAPAETVAEPPEPPAEPPPVAAAAPVAPPVAQPVEPPQDAAYWRARFETIEGKYRAEVPRLNQALQETQQALAQLRGQVESVQRQSVPPAAPPAPLVSDADETKFGADLIDLVRRVAREERRGVEEMLTRVEKTIRSYAPHIERVQHVEKQVIGTREEQFYSALSSAVPDWQTVNQDPRWLKWLEQFETLAGKTRQQLLDEAAAGFDAKRAAAMFNLFKSSEAAQQPSPQAQAQSELARQVAPSRSATTTVQPQGEKVYTAQEYQYWLDYRRIHDTPKEKLEKMLAEMDRALQEGRVKF